MPSVFRIQYVLTGWDGAPGVNTWHATRGTMTEDINAVGLKIAEDIKPVYTALKAYAPNAWNAVASGVVSEFDEESGALIAIGAYSTAGLEETSSVSTTAGNVNRASQLVMQCKTDQIRGNRVLQGRQYLGPINSIALTTSGTISATVRSNMEAAYAAITSGLGPRLAIWGQPSLTNPVGKVGDVVSVQCNVVPGILRRRRD